MPCICLEDRQAIFIEAIQQGINSLAALPGAMSIVRNGGCEQTLRSLLLWPLESALNCISFTEAGGERIDIMLRCCQCGDQWAKIELKKNFMHNHQFRWINQGRLRAMVQLNGNMQTTHAYYLHIFTQLIAPEGSVIRHAHNVPMVPTYKHFLLPEEAQAVQAIFEDEMAGPPLMKPVTITHPKDAQATATVWCWGYRLTDARNFENLMAPPQVPVS